MRDTAAIRPPTPTNLVENKSNEICNVARRNFLESADVRLVSQQLPPAVDANDLRRYPLFQVTMSLQYDHAPRCPSNTKEVEVTEYRAPSQSPPQE
ncbi:hypothetical protein H2248_003625 [Termitomyces sp. 'cryptogamus']|nr:hypothetical protein H2248_003625 [Termitomyces sp. 'cryptogamus']